MWFLVSVVKGSKYFDTESQIDNRLMISDTTDMIVTGYGTSTGSYRFEMRKGNEAFTLQDIAKGTSKEVMLGKFLALAEQLGARTLTSTS